MTPVAATWSGVSGRHSVGAVRLEAWRVCEPGYPEQYAAQARRVPVDETFVLMIQLGGEHLHGDNAAIAAGFEACARAVAAVRTPDRLDGGVEYTPDVRAMAWATAIAPVRKVFPGVPLSNYGIMQSNGPYLPKGTRYAPCLYGRDPIGEQDNLRRLAWNLDLIQSPDDTVWLGTEYEVGPSLTFRPYLPDLASHVLTRAGGRNVALFDPVAVAPDPRVTFSPALRDGWDTAVTKYAAVVGDAEWAGYVGSQIYNDAKGNPYAYATACSLSDGSKLVTFTRRAGATRFNFVGLKSPLPLSEKPVTEIVRIPA